MQRLTRRRLRSWSLLGSGSLHACVATGLVVQFWWSLNAASLAPPAPRGIVIEGGFLPEPARPEMPAVAIADAVPTSLSDDASAAPVVDAAALSAQVRTAIAEAQQLPVEDQLAQLERRAAELNRVSTAESVERMAQAISGLLGTKPRAEQPVDQPAGGKPEGEFDFNTAQLHDVRREMLESGEVRYGTVLVDAQGRRFETEVDAATGEQLLKVFNIMRGNPLLEKVYRRVVMGLLDQLARPVGPVPAVPNP